MPVALRDDMKRFLRFFSCPTFGATSNPEACAIIEKGRFLESEKFSRMSESKVCTPLFSYEASNRKTWKPLA